MLEKTSMPLAIEQCHCALLSVVSLSQLMRIYSHALLNDTEKLLWLLLAQYAVNDKDLSCEFNYQQLSTFLNKQCDVIHRALVRLRAMGYLLCDLPFSNGEITPEMNVAMRLFTPVEPIVRQIKPTRGVTDFVVLEKGVYRRSPILINLLSKNKKEVS